MRLLLFGVAVLVIVLSAPALHARAEPRLTFACGTDNDLFATVQRMHRNLPRFDSPAAAIASASAESAVLVLADAYPAQRTVIDPNDLKIAREKKLRLFIEYPDSLPGLKLGSPQKATWERLVVATDGLGDELPKLRILMSHECRYIPVEGIDNPLVVLARVAGYDSAVYGLPRQRSPILFELPEHNVLVSTTKLSHFITGRYAPARQWKALWRYILHHLDPEAEPIDLGYTPIVGVALGRDEAVTPAAERQAVQSAARWITNARLLIPREQLPEITERLTQGIELFPAIPAGTTRGDGSLGILEGYASGIQTDGSQLQRQPIRLDCQVESAMVLALSAENGQAAIAGNLLDYSYFTSDMVRNGPRGDPDHPSYGLLAWGAVSPAWRVANYGDDNARAILATIVAAAALKTDRYDESLLSALHANLRTTGKFGFRGDRIDQPQLEQLGWKHFHDAETVNPAPHFEAYLWACYLWAYHQTGDVQFLDRTKTAIRMTMDAYAKKGWRWNSNLERAHMLLPLAWLVRVEDTPEHRGWLQVIAKDLLSAQVECGAIQEQLAHTPGGHFFSAPASNEAYGIGETPLVQDTTDPASDQLYTTGFALLALREAAFATDDATLREAEDQLAAYLCRIQTRSETRPEFDGWWFRAFDYEKWEPWASSADIGWGAWSLEAGWAQAWTAATLAFRARETTFWDMTESSAIEKQRPAVLEKMLRNSGGPLKE